MPFEKFTKIGGSYAPKISIRTNGQLGLNQGTIRKFSLSEGDWYVVLYYDREERKIGIRKTRDHDEEGAAKLIRREVKTKEGQSSMNCYISCKSFLDFYEIDYTKTRNYRAEWDDNEGMIVVSLEPASSEEKTEEEMEADY